MNKKEKILKIIISLSFLGVLVALYALYEYYFGSADSICNINSKFSCTAVNQSGYSDIYGIPVSVFGVFGYALIATVASKREKCKLGNYKNILLGLSAFSFLFSIYLAAISAFVIKVWCPTCIVSYFIILILLICAIILKLDKEQQSAIDNQ